MLNLRDGVETESKKTTREGMNVRLNTAILGAIIVQLFAAIWWASSVQAGLQSIHESLSRIETTLTERANDHEKRIRDLEYRVWGKALPGPANENK